VVLFRGDETVNGKGLSLLEREGRSRSVSAYTVGFAWSNPLLMADLGLFWILPKKKS
jgi:hypothetical protein